LKSTLPEAAEAMLGKKVRQAITAVIWTVLMTTAFAFEGVQQKKQLRHAPITTKERGVMLNF